MLKNFHDYDDINRLTFHIILSLILCPLSKTAYLAIMGIVFLIKASFFCQMFRFKSQKVKNSLKLNDMFTLYIQFLVEICIFPNYLHFN